MNKTLQVVLVAMCLLCPVVVHAEDLRVWTAVNGQTLEARFIQMSGPKVVLEKTDGKRIMIPKKNLCQEDQVYLASAIPPELKISVDKDVDSQKMAQGYSYTREKEMIDIEVTIEKVSKDECSRKFKANLYILAEAKQGGLRKVIGHTDHSFSFEDGDSTQFSGSAEIQNAEGYSYEWGFEYEGYLIVVEDENGNLIKVDTNKNTYESNLDKIKKNDGKEFRM